MVQKDWPSIGGCTHFWIDIFTAWIWSIFQCDLWMPVSSTEHCCLIPPHPPPTELWTHVFPMGVIQIQSGLCAAQKPVQQKITLFVEPARLNNLTGPAFFYWPHSISHSFSWRLYVQNVWAITLTVSSAPSPPPSGAKYWLLSRFTHFYSNHRCQ